MTRPRTLVSTLLAGGALARTAVWLCAWSCVAYTGFLLRPRLALVWMTLVFAALLVIPRAAPAGMRRRAAATVGRRGFAPAAPWLVLALPVCLLMTVLTIAVNMRFTAELGTGYVDYRFASLPLGALVLPLWAIGPQPLIEELAFRGFLQGRLARRFGPAIAVTIAAALFAALHLSRAWLLYYFVGGLLYGYARLTTRSIWPATVLHSADNAMLFGLSAALEAFWTRSAGVPLWLLILALIASASAAVLLLRASGRATRRRQRERVARTTTVLDPEPTLTVRAGTVDHTEGSEPRDQHPGRASYGFGGVR